VSLSDKRLILVMGKGGVGRSTLSAAIALWCARRGKKTLLYEYNANDRLGRLFGKEPVGDEMVELAENLTAINTTPASAIEEYGLMVLRFRRVYEMVFENRVTKHFLRAVPGIDDYSILGKAWYHTTEMTRGKPTWDTVVFDMAASGHSLAMLKLPWVILETVPEGPLRSDAKKIRALIQDPNRTGIVLCTLPEEMPVNEALELEAQLRDDLGLSPTQLLANQVYPDHFPHGSSAHAVQELLEKKPGPLAPLAAHAATAQSRRRLCEQYLAVLAKKTSVPVAHLPRLFRSALGPEDLDVLSQAIADACA